MADSYIRTKQDETQFTQLLQAIRSGGGGGGGGSTVEVEQTQTSGDEIAKIIVDGISTTLFSKQTPTIETSGNWKIFKFANNFCIMIYNDTNCSIASWSSWGQIYEAKTGLSQVAYPYEFASTPYVKISFSNFNSIGVEYQYNTINVGDVYALRSTAGSTTTCNAVIFACGIIKEV